MAYSIPQTHTMVKEATVKKETFTYVRDASGHLMCDKCTFKPKSTVRYPLGNPSTMHYHLKKHEGNYQNVCSICKHTFLHKMTLDTHMAARHPEVQEQAQQKHEVFKCPIEGCEFEALTKANRRIHFLRKHCNDILNNYCEELVLEDKKYLRCVTCSERFNSNTAFHYHCGKCFLTHNIEVHPLLESVC